MNQKIEQDPLQMIRQYWNTIRHFRWWIALGTVPLTLVCFTIIALLPDVYQSTTTILVDPQKIPERYVSATVSSDLGQRLAMISQEVLSATRLEQIIDRLHLFEDRRGKLSREEIIDLVRKNITIEVKGGSGLSAFTITYTGGSPAVVAQTANELAGSFIEWNLQVREQQAVGTTQFLNTQLDQAKKNLEDLEHKLSEFKLAHVGEMPNQQPTNLQILAQLQSQVQANSEALNRLDLQRTMLLRGVGQGQNGAPVPQTERGRLELERRQTEERIRDLRRRYTAEFPDVVEAKQRLDRINAQLAALPPDAVTQTTTASSDAPPQLLMIDKEMKRLNAEQLRLQQQIQNYRAKVEAAPIREQQVADLMRNYDTTKANYQSLLEKTFSADMAADLERKQKAERFTILDPARVPEKPIKPKRLFLMFGSFVGCLFACIGAAILKDMLDPSVKTETEVRSLLPPSVGILASIAEIEIPAEARKQRFVLTVAIALAVVACLAEAAFWWKVHPFLGI